MNSQLEDPADKILAIQKAYSILIRTAIYFHQYPSPVVSLSPSLLFLKKNFPRIRFNHRYLNDCRGCFHQLPLTLCQIIIGGALKKKRRAGNNSVSLVARSSRMPAAAPAAGTSAATTTASTATPAATNGASPTTAKKPALAPEKKYICVHCGRGFSRSEHRSRHERSRELYLYLILLSQIQGGVYREKTHRMFTSTTTCTPRFEYLLLPTIVTCQMPLLTRHHCRYQRTSLQVSKMPEYFCSSRSFVTT